MEKFRLSKNDISTYQNENGQSKLISFPCNGYTKGFDMMFTFTVAYKTDEIKYIRQSERQNCDLQKVRNI